MKKLNVIIITVLFAALLFAGCSKADKDLTTTSAPSTVNASTDSASAPSAEAVSNDGTQENVNGKQCPYCGLVYDGDNVEAYNAHVAACAQAEGGKSTLAVCPYCGESFSTVIDDPQNPGVSLYDSHITQEEWEHREYVMCQLCGEYYKNGTEHTCKSN